MRPPDAREMDLPRNVTLGQDTRQSGLSDGSHERVRVILAFGWSDHGVRVGGQNNWGQIRDSDPNGGIHGREFQQRRRTR